MSDKQKVNVLFYNDVRKEIKAAAFKHVTEVQKTTEMPTSSPALCKVIQNHFERKIISFIEGILKDIEEFVPGPIHRMGDEEISSVVIAALQGLENRFVLDDLFSGTGKNKGKRDVMSKIGKRRG